MRLTLRTLLSYLDDTLEPAQAKAIGAKVAESEQARDLVERIKQVTRRRRLTTPPNTGPGGIDANTIAEYLDNEVTPEQAAEVEQICLASDVHLAEVAACHQILTLVLGEPALVPPSAKQRMYGLVKGPESIPFRKPAKAGTKDDLDLSSDMEADHDDTLRMGVPAVSGKSGGKLWMFIGAGVLAACILVVAVWQLVLPIVNKPGEKKDGNQFVQADKKDTDKKDDSPKTDDKKKDVVGADKTKDMDKKDKDKDLVKDQDQIKDKDKDEKIGLPKKDNKGSAKADAIVEPVDLSKLKGPPEVGVHEASKKQAPIGKVVPSTAKEPAVLLQATAEKGGWTRLMDKTTQVMSGRALLAIPGSKSAVNLDTGVELTVWGNLPEVTLDSSVSESRVIVHAHDILDADLTLDRGRILVKNNKKTGGEARVRVRFINPMDGAEEFFDITLYSGAAVVVERVCAMDREEPFRDDPKDKLRQGPFVSMRVFAATGAATIRKDVTLAIDEMQQMMAEYQPRQGALTYPKGKITPPAWLKGMPKISDKNDLARRTKILESHNELAKIMEKGKKIDVALAEIVVSTQEATLKETGKGKVMSLETYTQWRFAILCYAAIDDIGTLFDLFAKDDTPLFVRGVCMMTLQQWLAQGRENDYEMLDVVRKNNIKKTASIKIMERFHMVSSADAAKPGTYQHLIEDLNNDLLPIRALSHWHLTGLVPAGQAIPYDPAMPPQLRVAAVRQWMQLIPAGSMPPKGMPPTKKDKG
jgi:hypothetical protein